MELRGHIIPPGTYSPAGAPAGRLQELRERQRGLRQALGLRLRELRRLCLQEAELTGKLPPEYPLEPGERPQPPPRRRAGGPPRGPLPEVSRGEGGGKNERLGGGGGAQNVLIPPAVSLSQSCISPGSPGGAPSPVCPTAVPVPLWWPPHPHGGPLYVPWRPPYPYCPFAAPVPPWRRPHPHGDAPYPNGGPHTPPDPLRPPYGGPRGPARPDPAVPGPGSRRRRGRPGGRWRCSCRWWRPPGAWRPPRGCPPSSAAAASACRPRRPNGSGSSAHSSAPPRTMRTGPSAISRRWRTGPFQGCPPRSPPRVEPAALHPPGPGLAAPTIGPPGPPTPPRGDPADAAPSPALPARHGPCPAAPPASRAAASRPPPSWPAAPAPAGPPSAAPRRQGCLPGPGRAARTRSWGGPRHPVPPRQPPAPAAATARRL